MLEKDECASPSSSADMSERQRFGPSAVVWSIIIGMSMLRLLSVVRQLSEGFWLDEITSWWIVHSSFSDVFARATQFHSHWPTYYWLLWIWTAIFGDSETTFRSLSLALFLTAIVVFGLSIRRFLGKEAAAVAVCLCLSSSFLEIFVHARPYALACLSVSLTIYCALGFVERPTVRGLVLYAAFATLTIYIQYVYAIALVATFALTWNVTPSWRYRAIIAHLGCFVGAMPIMWHMRVVHDRVLSSNWMRVPSIQELLCFLQPSLLVLAIALVVVLRVHRIALDAVVSEHGRYLSVLLLLWLLPPFALLAISYFAGTPINGERYVAFEVFGISGLFALGTTKIPNWKERALFILLLIVIGNLPPRQLLNYGDSWKQACQLAARLQQESMGSEEWLLYNGMNESSLTAWIHSPVQRRFLLAPLQYCGEGSRDALIVPFRSEQREVVDEIVGRVVSDGRPRVYISRWWRDLTGVRQRLIAHGWQVIDRSAGGIAVGVFYPPAQRGTL